MMKRISMLMVGLLVTAGLHAGRAADYTSSVAKTGDAYAQGDYHQAGDAGRVYKNKSTSKESVTQRQYRAQGSRHQDREQGIHSARDKRSGNGSRKPVATKSTSSEGQCSHKYDQVELNSGLEHETVYLTFNNAEQMAAVAPYEQVRVCYSNDPQQGKNPMWLSISEGDREILPLTMVSRPNDKKPKSVAFNKDRAGENAGKIYIRVHYAGRASDQWRVEPAMGNNPARLVPVENRVAVQKKQ